MKENERANTTALPINERPEVHQAGAGSGRSAPISLEHDKELREGQIPASRFDDQRMKDRTGHGAVPETPERVERGGEVRADTADKWSSDDEARQEQGLPKAR